ncbi:MAG: hypothetical protein LKJ66_03625 [Clostridium luticellarii]|uniref:hypothetical protein n=1 Tax=Clostridium luticellarii TaxID=1691940 RepID=UPI0023560547|nr:hypothetical protein [Clostridium luticellarii]MCI2039149.1 hypothetical protein [Clostridium luticellarii]
MNNHAVGFQELLVHLSLYYITHVDLLQVRVDTNVRLDVNRNVKILIGEKKNKITCRA